MNTLLIHPKYPKDTFWGFGKSLPFVNTKAAFPPLGLLTMAAMLPGLWTKRLVDANVRRLKDKDIAWADLVFISAMIIQKDSAQEIIARCKAMGKKVVVGGPLFSTDQESFPDADHFVLDEAEVTLPPFLKDLEKGVPRRVYTSSERPDLALTPVPDWSLIKLRHYSSMSIQFSRGCPFKCEFCYVSAMYGQELRLKPVARIIAELEALRKAGWKGSIFFVDDNLIGNIPKSKELLRAVIEWQEEHHFPFTFFTQASVNLAGDPELLDLMRRANFNKVFLGIETPNVASLEECGKRHNAKIDLAEAVRKIQRSGMQVMAGFIAGFDHDTKEVFAVLSDFIQKTGVVVAQVGILNALPRTRFWERMKAEGRLLDETTGDAVVASVNFHPKMGKEALIAGYKELLAKIYSPKGYYARVAQFVKNYKPTCRKRFSRFELEAFALSLLRVGVFSRSNWRYTALLVKTFFTKPRAVPVVVESAIQGVHFQWLAKRLASA